MNIIPSFCRDFTLVCNQFKLWMLTSDISYLRDSSLKGFSTLIQKNKNLVQVIVLKMCKFLITKFFMQEIFDKSFITDIFTNEIYRNKLQVVGYHYLVDHQLMILIVIRLDWP